MLHRESLDDYISSFFTPLNYTELIGQVVNSGLFHYGLQVFNWTCDSFDVINNELIRFIGSIYREYSSIGHKWIFLHNEYLPIPCWNVKSLPFDYDYTYDDSVKVLREKNCIYFNIEDFSLDDQYVANLNWVMASVTTYETDKDGNSRQGTTLYLEDIYDLNIVGSIDSSGCYYYPTPDTLLACWSIHSGIWFDRNSPLHLAVMTNKGEMLEFRDIFNADNQSDDWFKALGIDDQEVNTKTENVVDCEETADNNKKED